MGMTPREFWTLVHGMIFGATFLLAFTGGLVALWDFRAGFIRAEDASIAARRLMWWTWTMAAVAWITVILGTYLVYPWYRAKAPAGLSTSELAKYPRSLLLSNPRTADWHEFGMEWKEHVAWLAPILATAVAWVVTRYWKQVLSDANLRRALLVLFALSFFCAGVAGLFGALINKAAPIR